MRPGPIALFCLAGVVLTAPPARAEPAIRSPVEAGSLARGQFAVRAGSGLGAGPSGVFSGQLVAGLGRLDTAVGLGVVDYACAGSWGCVSAWSVSGGLQLRLRSWRAGRTSLGARFEVNHLVASQGYDPSDTTVAALGLWTGGRRHRGLLELAVLDHRGRDGPEGHIDGLYAGPVIGYALLGERVGAALLVGAGVPLRGGSAPVAVHVASLSVFVR